MLASATATKEQGALGRRYQARPTLSARHPSTGPLTSTQLMQSCRPGVLYLRQVRSDEKPGLLSSLQQVVPLLGGARRTRPGENADEGGQREGVLGGMRVRSPWRGSRVRLHKS